MADPFYEIIRDQLIKCYRYNNKTLQGIFDIWKLLRVKANRPFWVECTECPDKFDGYHPHALVVVI